MGYSRYVRNADDAIDYLETTTDCPRELIAQLRAWAETPVVGKYELALWLDACKARPSAEKGEGK